MRFASCDGSSPAHCGTFAAVSMAPVKRFICRFLIVWLTLLSGITHAHAATHTTHPPGHASHQATNPSDSLSSSQVGKKAPAAHASEHAETCSLSHCGHSHTTGMLPNLPLRLDGAAAGAPLPAPQAWASREQPNNIERPKWVFTTPSVVNL